MSTFTKISVSFHGIKTFSKIRLLLRFALFQRGMTLDRENKFFSTLLSILRGKSPTQLYVKTTRLDSTRRILAEQNFMYERTDDRGLPFFSTEKNDDHLYSLFKVPDSKVTRNSLIPARVENVAKGFAGLSMQGNNVHLLGDEGFHVIRVNLGKLGQERTTLLEVAKILDFDKFNIMLYHGVSAYDFSVNKLLKEENVEVDKDDEIDCLYWGEKPITMQVFWRDEPNVSNFLVNNFDECCQDSSIFASELGYVSIYDSGVNVALVDKGKFREIETKLESFGFWKDPTRGSFYVKD